MQCRFCNQELSHTFVDLDNSPPSNSFLTARQLQEPESHFPLKLFVCSHCFLVQVDEFKKRDEIFNHEYVYFSSFSKSWLAHARKYTDMMAERFSFDENTLVIEIASNDGYLLQYFKEKNIPVLGIEPSANTAAVAALKGIPSISDYFTSALALKLKKEKREADLLIGNNVLAHVPDINDFVEGLKLALRKNGVITMEFPHLLKLIEESQFDTIYHEHFSYLSFTTVKAIFQAHGLELFDVEELPTHGGSLRIYAKHSKDTAKPISERVQAMLEKEATAGLTTLDYYHGFKQKVSKIKLEFLQFLLAQKSKGKKVIGYGAAAKGNTLLNYSGIKGNELIEFVVDASPYKQNKFLPGSHIPVYGEEKIKEYQPDFIIIFPWNLKHEIIDQLSYVGEWGCKIVTFIPYIHIHEYIGMEV
jgi:SAM-dependent methyltransferase